MLVYKNETFYLKGVKLRHLQEYDGTWNFCFVENELDILINHYANISSEPDFKSYSGFSKQEYLNRLLVCLKDLIEAKLKNETIVIKDFAPPYYDFVKICASRVNKKDFQRVSKEILDFESYLDKKQAY